jgi:4-carboxymuconolactone decarboxylase
LEGCLRCGRYEKGLARMAEIDHSQLERIIARLADIGPDFARYVVKFAFGDI